MKAKGEVLGADFLAPGISPWPLSIDFLMEATGLNSQLSMDETGLLLSLLMLGLTRHPKWS